MELLKEHRFIEESRLEAARSRPKRTSHIVEENEVTPPFGSLKKYSSYQEDRGDSRASSFCSALEILLRARGDDFVPCRAYFAHKESLIEEFSCLGDAVQDGIGYVEKYGIISEEDWDKGEEEGEIRTISYHCCIPRDALSKWITKDVEGAISQGHPVLAEIHLYESFAESLEKGVVPLPKAGDGYLGAYRMVIVGYTKDKKLFTTLVALEGWRDGYVYLPYDYVTNPEWTIEFTVLLL